MYALPVRTRPPKSRLRTAKGIPPARWNLTPLRNRNSATPPLRVSHRPRCLGSLRNALYPSAGPVVIGEYGGVAVARVTAAEPRLVDAVTAGAMTRSTDAVEREEVVRIVHNKHVEQKPGGRV